MRIRTPLLGVAAAVAAAIACVAPGARAEANAPRARFFLPEPPRTQHTLLLEVLEELGIERFVPPNSEDPSEAAQNPLYLWSFLPSVSERVDLVWSVAASPPYEQLSFPASFRPMLNHLPGAERLTSADALHKHIKRAQEKHGKFYFNFVPDRFVLPRDEAAMAQAFPAVLKKVEFELKRERDWFIYQRFLVREQPASGDESAQTPAQLIITEQELAEKLASEFRGKRVEVASYVEPYLLDGHKFRVGFYVAVTSLDPLRVYVFRHAAVQIAREPYPADVRAYSSRGAYAFEDALAPWDFAELQPLFHEFPSPAREGSDAWALVKRRLLAQGLDTRRLQRELDDAIVRTVASSRAHFQAEAARLKRASATGEPTPLADRAFDLWKFEFELDDAGKPWLTGVLSNPSLAPRQSAFGSDEAIKRALVRDLVALLGVHPHARQSFDAFAGAADAAFCAARCADRARAWDAHCWSCPGWFPPDVARRLFEASREYARRGRFRLVFPDLARDHARFLDAPLSDHDVALDRYLKSLASGYAEKPPLPLARGRHVACVYREHCSGNGDCVNGACRCDRGYEGATCYLPRDPAGDGAPAPSGRGEPAGETWKQKVGHLWQRSPAPAALERGGADADASAGQGSAEGVSAAKLGLGLLMLAAFALAAHRVFAAYAPTSHDRKSN